MIIILQADQKNNYYKGTGIRDLHWIKILSLRPANSLKIIITTILIQQTFFQLFRPSMYNKSRGLECFFFLPSKIYDLLINFIKNSDLFTKINK